MTKITSREFGKTKDGQAVTAFTLTNSNAMSVTILDFGCSIQSITLLDKNGVRQDMALGYDDVASYEQGGCFYGAVVGRFANRIGGATFVLDGKRYQLEKTPGESNHVHGIFAKKMFHSSIEKESVVMTYMSPDMEEGFPGNLNVEVRFSLSEDNAIEIAYKATTDAPTILNLTNHCYFNLNGQDGSTIYNHKLRLNCSHFTEYNDDFSQSGNIIDVTDTPLDFRKEKTIGEDFDKPYRQVRICTGYDHNMIIDGELGQLKLAAICSSDVTGISLETYTTEPAIHFYSSNYLEFDPVKFGKNGLHYPRNGAVCFEAQHYPDSPNHSHFPSVVLRPGETYTQKTIYKFKTSR